MGTTIESSWENERLKEQLAAAQAREAELLAHVERLREAIKDSIWQMVLGPNALREIMEPALDATPAQSLARLRNDVLEEAAKVCISMAQDELGNIGGQCYDCADAIRELKEPI